MLWLLAAGWLLTVLVCWTFHLLMVRDLQTTHRQREATWELKEERLLNRCMTQHWQDYAQMQVGMQSSVSDIPGEGIGLSDESEALKWAAAQNGTGLGESIEDELKDLGILP